MKKLLILFLFVSTGTFAQTSKPSSTWELEIDPIAYVFKGYSFHGIYQPGRFRFDAGIYGIQMPESFHGNKGFRVNTQGFTLKSHYLIRGTRGFFAGIGSGFSITEAKHQESGATATGHAIGLGPELGYRFFFSREKDGKQKGFYLSPWVGMSYNFSTREISFADLEYKQQKWTFFPTLHIGYRL